MLPGLGPAARRARAGAAGRHAAIAGRWRAGGRSTLAVIGESYDGPVRHRHAERRAARADRGDHRVREVGAAADDRRLARGRQPARRDDVRARRLQGRQRVRRLRAAAAHRRHGHRPRPAPGRAGAGLAVGRADPARAHPGRGRRQGHRGLPAAASDKRQARPLPRLVIVIDEFASMVRDLPDFVTGLVNIAQRGRSLGIHLILATQRPSGVVSADIRANTNLRIALRVTDPAESADVIGVPDAAHHLPVHARAAPTSGSATPRSCRSRPAGSAAGGPGAGPRDHRARPWLAPLDWASLGKPEPARPAAGHARTRRRSPTSPSWSRKSGAPRAGCVSRARTARGCAPLPPSAAPARRHAGVPRPDRPAGSAPACVFGLDRPAGGAAAAAGGPQPGRLRPPDGGRRAAVSGRSQLLRTIAGALALTHSRADVHLYGIDCGNGALLPLAELPHCGAVVSRAQTERAARLLRRLAAELGSRQELLAAGRVRRHPRAAGRRSPERRSGCRTSSCCSTGGRDSPPRWASWTAGGLTDTSPGCSARAPAPACTW